MAEHEDERSREIRKRQRSRATVLGLILGAFAILVFAITIAKIKAGMAH